MSACPVHGVLPARQLGGRAGHGDRAPGRRAARRKGPMLVGPAWRPAFASLPLVGQGSRAWGRPMSACGARAGQLRPVRRPAASQLPPAAWPGTGPMARSGGTHGGRTWEPIAPPRLPGVGALAACLWAGACCLLVGRGVGPGAPAAAPAPKPACPRGAQGQGARQPAVGGRPMPMLARAVAWQLACPDSPWARAWGRGERQAGALPAPVGARRRPSGAIGPGVGAAGGALQNSTVALAQLWGGQAQLREPLPGAPCPPSRPAGGGERPALPAPPGPRASHAWRP